MKMKIFFPAVAILFCFISAVESLVAAEIAVRRTTLYLSNRSLTLKAGVDGRLESVRSVLSGKEYLDTSMPQPFMYVTKAGREFPSTSITLTGNELRVSFGQANVAGIVTVDARDDCFIFELTGVRGEGIEVFGLSRMTLSLNRHIGNILNVARDDDFGICLLGLNLRTHARGASREKAVLCVDCIPRFGMEGARFAVIGVPVAEMLPVIGSLEKEFGLPHPMIDGAWDKVSRAVETSYLFTDGDQMNIEKCIEYAKAGGFGYLMLLGGVFTSYGHYEINTQLFPDSLEGLKATMKKIHDAGLKGGIHFLIGWISKDDPYVTPVPDPRLAKDEKMILAAGITADADFIPVRELPGTLPAEPQYVGKGGCDLQIGDEIIFYGDLSKMPPYGFTGCKRGMYGTKAASHAGNDTVYHMMETWRHYVVGAETDMLEEMAARMGAIFNECEVDMLYFDGAETMSVLGPGWYYVGKVQEAYYRQFKRDILYQGSTVQTFGWHIISRGNSDDWTALAIKRFLDNHKVPNRVQVYHDNFLPAEFGWWGFFTHSPSVDATLPDEVEYGYSKGAGYDTPVGFEPHIEALEGNGRTREIFSMMKRWEEARLSGRFSERMKQELRTTGQEHTLRQGNDGSWNVHRITYGPDHYVKTNSPSSFAWSQVNSYGEQPLRLRMRAKFAQAAYNDGRNIDLTKFTDVHRFTSSASSAEIDIDVAVSNEHAREGMESWKITARNNGEGSGGWAMLEYRFPEVLDLRNNRAPGVWVHGDGSGALLNVSLVESRGVMRRDHYIDLNFTGWRYCELAEPEAERVYEFKWPYGVKWPTRHVNYADIGRIQFYITRIPVRGSAACSVSPVKALRDIPVKIINPVISVNGMPVMFPVTLRDDEYIEYWGGESAIHYDPNNVILSELVPVGDAHVKEGLNTFVYSDESGSGDKRVKITVTTLGDILQY